MTIKELQRVFSRDAKGSHAIKPNGQRIPLSLFLKPKSVIRLLSVLFLFPSHIFSRAGAGIAGYVKHGRGKR